MKSRIAGLALLVATTACAGLQTGDLGPDPVSELTPLDVYLYPAAGQPGGFIFDLNKPAHVAVFRISPGLGTALVYPRAGLAQSDARFARAGLNWIPSQSVRLASRELSRRNVGVVSMAQGPSFYFVVASENPLDFREIGRFGDNLPWALGGAYASSAYTTMESLTQLMVPNWETGEWAADFFVDWAVPTTPMPQERLVRITCDGKEAYVPLSQARLAAEYLCAAELDDAGVEERIERGSDDEVDEIVIPSRRDPEQPSTPRITSDQLQNPLEWQERRDDSADEIQAIENRRFADDSRSGTPAAVSRSGVGSSSDRMRRSNRTRGNSSGNSASSGRAVASDRSDISGRSTTSSSGGGVRSNPPAQGNGRLDNGQ